MQGVSSRRERKSSNWENVWGPIGAPHSLPPVVGGPGYMGRGEGAHH